MALAAKDIMAKDLTVLRPGTTLPEAVRTLIEAGISGAHGVDLGGRLLGVHLFLRLRAGPRRVVFITLAALGLLGLLVLHKLPWLSGRAGRGPLATSLSVVGFSYVALRMVEVIRAVFEKRGGRSLPKRQSVRRDGAQSRRPL